MNAPRQEKTIYQLFRIGLLLKGANAILEIVGGVLALLIRPTAITQLAFYLTAGELEEDPYDFVATHLLHWVQHLSVQAEEFAALYLLSHGIVKLALVIGLLQGQRWAYPGSLFVFGLFVLYQVYLFTINHSLGLIALTVFDVIVMWFIWREYQIVRAHPNARQRQEPH